MDEVEPVDGFSVEVDGAGQVILTLSNRYGEGERYTFGAGDALDIGHALVHEASRALAGGRDQ